MPVLTGKVQEKTEKRTTNDDPFIAFKIDVGRKFPISVNDFELRGDHLKVGDQVSWEIEEEPGVIEGRNVTYRTLIAVRDADDGPDLTDMEYDIPPPRPQEPRSASSGTEGIEGVIRGAKGHDAAAMLAPALPKPSVQDGTANDDRGWPNASWHALAAVSYAELGERLYEQHPQ
jgi:hypothetical protein